MAKAEEKKGGALATFAASLPQLDVKAAAAALRDSSREGSTGSADGQYLSFSGKKGTYALGRDKKKPDPDAIYIVEPLAAVEGWTCWKGGKPVGKHEWSVFERAVKAIPEGNLQDHGPYKTQNGEGWAFMMGLGLLDVDDPTTPIKFTLNSVSGRNVFAAFNEEVADMWEQGEDGIALVKLGSEDFEAQGQTNSKPVIEVLGWVSRQEVQAFMDDVDATVDQLLNGDLMEEEEKPAPKASRKAAAPAAEPEPEEVEEAEEEPAAPPRRRRRAAA